MSTSVSTTSYHREELYHIKPAIHYTYSSNIKLTYFSIIKLLTYFSNIKLTYFS